MDCSPSYQSAALSDVCVVKHGMELSIGSKTRVTW